MADFDATSAIITYTDTYPSISVWSMGHWIYADAAPPQFSSTWQSRTSGFVGFVAPNGSGAGQNDFQMDWEGNLFSSGSIDVGTGRWVFVAGVVDVAAGTVKTFGWIPATSTLMSDSDSGILTAKSPSSWSVGADSFLSSSRCFNGGICHLIAEVAVWTPTQIIAMGRGMHPLDVVRRPAFYRSLINDRAPFTSKAIPIGTNVGVRGGAPVMPRRLRSRDYDAAATSPPPPPAANYNLPLLGVGD